MQQPDLTLIIQGICGLFAFLVIGWICSENRKGIDIKSILIALLTQIVLAFLTTRIDIIRNGFLHVSQGINTLRDATIAGTSFVFGYVGGGTMPFEVKTGANTFIFAFQALPMVMVVSAISMLLFHWNILPIIVKGFSWSLRKTLRIGGALGVSMAAKVFLGQTEAPLLIRPYLRDLSRSELFTVMAAGMATTSATIMVLYATILEGTIADPISHILTASIISIPAAIAISRVMIPHEGTDTAGDLIVPYNFTGSMEAVSQGATDGLKLFLNIIAMLIVMLALVYLANAILACFPNFLEAPISLQRVFGWFMAPIAWLMGIPWSESQTAGNLIGTKTVINEIMAFIDLSQMPKGSLSPRVDLMMTYALCGFANFSSIAIQIGGLGAMVPERRKEIISLGFKALLAGTIASCMSGTVIGLLWWLS